HTVVDFEHEHRASQHQHVAHAADDGRAVERATARSARRCELRANRKLVSTRLATLHQLVPDETRVPALLRATPNSLKSKPHSLNMTRMRGFVHAAPLIKDDTNEGFCLRSRNTNVNGGFASSFLVVATSARYIP